MFIEDKTSAIEKACRVLKALSDGRNTRLVDIANYVGLDKSTVMRVLDILTREGLVARDSESKRYRLGVEIARIANGVSEEIDWRGVARPSLLRLSGEFEDTTLMSVVSGLEMICVDLQTGSYPVRANFQAIGSRRTLGVGSSGLAVLAAFREPERNAALSQIGTRISRYPMLTPEFLRDAIARTQEKGYAVLIDAVVQRMGGIAVAIRSRSGEPIAALAISALSDRILEREEALGAALRSEAAKAEEALTAPNGSAENPGPR
ncbi:IclR family transcriptional regulator [Paraburkholderia dilworthii]|uniref:IclR family transcriptional regulator n=1 Tax=Paraburkholderia dilworthii TaxID=948106 RepID=A0ABW9D624_9BURK